jgi:type II secretory pathway component PulC
MRFVVAAVLLAAMTSVALADEDELVEAYAPLVAVAVMPDSGQALVYNQKDKQYELGKIGGTVGGWKIVAIEQTKIIVANASGPDELPLAEAPAQMVAWQPPVKKEKAAEPVVEIEKPTVVVEKKDPPPVQTPIENHTVTRGDLDRELGDFSRLEATIDVKARDGGGFVLTRVDPKSWVATMGLATGDIVHSIAGELVSTVEDAARVYARLHTMNNFEIDVERGGKRITLHYDVVKARRP